MDLIERYLAAVGATCRAKADDIVAELRDVLTARMEDQEEAARPAADRGGVGLLLMTSAIRWSSPAATASTSG